MSFLKQNKKIVVRKERILKIDNLEWLLLNAEHGERFS